MPITFHCSCGQSLTVPNAYAGRGGKCPRCSQSVVAPAPPPDPSAGGLKWTSATEYEQAAIAGAGPMSKAPPSPEAAPTNSPKTAPKTSRQPAPENIPIPAPAPAAPSAAGPRLTIVSEGRLNGISYGLAEHRCAVVGRDQKNEVAVPSSAISRHHCQIERGAQGYTVTDLGSANGTLVNGQHTISQQLKAGDYIQVGDTLLRFDA